MGHKSLKDSAKENPSQIGDPVSLKAETSDKNPKPEEAGAKGGDNKKSLKETAQDELKQNPTALGDPVSLKAETSDTIPTGNDLGALGQGEKPKSRL